MSQNHIKAVFFDFMGTCLDWHSGVANTLPSSIPFGERSQMALRWRQLYFDSNSARLGSGLPPEDIDLTLATTLRKLIGETYSKHTALFDDKLIDDCVTQWHHMPAWPEVASAIRRVQEAGFETFVFANGTTRLQLDLCRSSGLHFDMLFSSALLGVYKPAEESYEKVLSLVKLRPEETVMVAAHAYDLRGGKKAGMHTVYIKRWTDDIDEDDAVVRAENNFYLEDMKSLLETINALPADGA